MSETQLPQITLVRHGETAWSRSGQHTGRSDIPLTPAGEDAARTLAPRLAKTVTRRSGRARRVGRSPPVPLPASARVA